MTRGWIQYVIILAYLIFDVYQFIILILGFIITLALCVPDIIQNFSRIRSVIPDEFFQLDGGKGTLFLLSTFLAFILGETFAPGYATRYCVGKNIRETKKGIVGAGVFLAAFFPAVLVFKPAQEIGMFPWILCGNASDQPRNPRMEL
jgi:Na+/proline symporter